MQGPSSSTDTNKRPHKNEEAGASSSPSLEAATNSAQQAEWREAIRARMTNLKKSSSRVLVAQKRFLDEAIELSKPDVPCETCRRNDLLCVLSIPHIRCSSCTLKGATCSFGTIRVSRKRRARLEREQVIHFKHKQYVDTCRDLLTNIKMEARINGAEDIAEMVEQRMDECLAAMVAELETFNS
ncbi:hypothetical protein OC834_005159 [Tilletia horrida]|nr:hypothetical protein OC834_005159 [Tilletia horrida]KAK0557993.1 hypothetical protein OC844_005417 [Tilletia horrida]